MIMAKREREKILLSIIIICVPIVDKLITYLLTETLIEIPKLR